MKIQHLKWDSEFFNLKIGEIYFKSHSGYPENEGEYELLYVKTEDDKTYKNTKFKNTFIEQKITFSKTKLKAYPINDTKISSIFNVDFNINQLYKLAFESGKYSRFKLDENFNYQDFYRLYKQWIDNSLNKSFADRVLVYVEENNIYGLLTYKVDNDVANIGLFGVDPIKQGKGIGTKLLKSVETEIFNKGIKKICIPTQFKNQVACKFYEKSGYTIDTKIFIKHYWKI